MKHTISLLVFALCTAFASAQTLMPGRQVSVSTNDFEHIVPDPQTAQGAFQWVDDNWGSLDSTGWVTLAPTADTTQASFNWIDGWLTAFPDYLPGTNIVGAAFTNGQWTILPNEIPLSTNGWTWLDPTNATVQATFNFIDTEGPFAKLSDVAPIIEDYSQQFAFYATHTDYMDDPPNNWLLTNGAANTTISLTGFSRVDFSDDAYTNQWNNTTGALTLPYSGWYYVGGRVVFRELVDNRHSVLLNETYMSYSTAASTHPSVVNWSWLSYFSAETVLRMGVRCQSAFTNTQPAVTTAAFQLFYLGDTPPIDTIEDTLAP